MKQKCGNPYWCATWYAVIWMFGRLGMILFDNLNIGPTLDVPYILVFYDLPIMEQFGYLSIWATFIMPVLLLSALLLVFNDVHQMMVAVMGLDLGVSWIGFAVNCLRKGAQGDGTLAMLLVNLVYLGILSLLCCAFVKSFCKLKGASKGAKLSVKKKWNKPVWWAANYMHIWYLWLILSTCFDLVPLNSAVMAFAMGFNGVFANSWLEPILFVLPVLMFILLPVAVVRFGKGKRKLMFALLGVDMTITWSAMLMYWDMFVEMGVWRAVFSILLLLTQAFFCWMCVMKDKRQNTALDAVQTVAEGDI